MAISSTPGWAHISTSFPVLTLIVREFIDTDLQLNTMTKSGDETHHFEPSPKNLIQWQREDLLIVNGLGLEHWLPQIQARPNFGSKFVIASAGINPLMNQGHTPDPHAWLNPDNLVIYIENIQKRLQQQYPNKKELFRTKGDLLVKNVRAWQKQTDSQFSNLPKDALMITAHSSFTYLAQSFGISSLALLGDHDGETFSPRQMTLKLTEIKKSNHRVFFGDGNSQDTSLKNWATKTGSPWGGVLWGDTFPASSAPKTLLEYLNHNTALILSAFSSP
jgi:ABC-type Zn uptake system ZnuABC Zn-binding protein ZnuA